ncbi:MAG: flippase-like domain-containing protein [Ignavibacteriales bacterium]|nr:flippase-like domain-containing protein [Ignavibacteriales bacterium]
MGELRILNKKVIGVLISVVFIVLIALQIDVKKSLEAFKTIDFRLFPLIIPIFYLSFLVRAFRWCVILSGNNNLRIRSLISSLFIGFTANSLLPARMGEFYRAHIFGKKENIQRGKVFASIVLERILDGSMLFFILVSLIYFQCLKPWVFQLALLAGIIFIGGFLVLFTIAKYGKSRFLREHPVLAFFIDLVFKIILKFPNLVQDKIYKLINILKYLMDTFLEGLELLNSPKMIARAFYLSFFVWLLEGSCIFIVIRSFGIEINLFSALFVTCVTAFSTMIPSGPASIGPYQYGYMLALGVFGVSKEVAFAASVINQFSSVLLVSLAGLYYMWKDHINISELEDNKELETKFG